MCDAETSKTTSGAYGRSRSSVRRGRSWCTSMTGGCAPTYSRWSTSAMASNKVTLLSRNLHAEHMFGIRCVPHQAEMQSPEPFVCMFLSADSVLLGCESGIIVLWNCSPMPQSVVSRTHIQVWSIEPKVFDNTVCQQREIKLKAISTFVAFKKLFWVFLAPVQSPSRRLICLFR